MNSKSLYSIAIVSFTLLCTSCNNQQSSESTSEPVVRDSSQLRENVDTEMIQSVKTRTIALQDSVLGLFFGHFDATSIGLMLQSRYDSMEKAIVDDYDYFTIDERFYNSTTVEEKTYFYMDPLYGVWRLRKPSAISIILNQITPDSTIGKSICAGNERPIKMKSMVDDGDSIRLVLSEPGDDKYDGTFDLILAVNTGELTGRFMPYNEELPHKTLTAQGATFQYQPEGEEWAFDNDYLGKNISLEALTIEDVEDQSKQRLRILRNIIYARHGYSFKNKDVREFFESYDWYVPFSTDVRSDLTEIEKANIALIKRYEAYAEDYYDDFGR